MLSVAQTKKLRNYRTSNMKIIGKDTEEIGRCLRYYPCICLEGLRKTTKRLRTGALRTEVWSFVLHYLHKLRSFFTISMHILIWDSAQIIPILKISVNMNKFLYMHDSFPHSYSVCNLRNSFYLLYKTGVEGAVRGLEGTHPADTCILTKLE
jgi:hypothetical protein